MKSVILAAGKGTRLGALTKVTPKPLIPVAGKPVAEHIMTGMREAGINDFILITKHLEHLIKEYFGDGSKLGVNVSYITQPDGKYGTAAALECAENAVDGQPIMFGWGDIITAPQTYKAVAEIFARGDCDGVMSLNYMEDPSAGGAVYMTEDESKVVKIAEKQPKEECTSHWNSAGIFVFKPIIFDYLRNLPPSARGEYEISDAINNLIADGAVIRPYFLKDIWCDVGTPQDIITAEKILKDAAK